MSLKRISETFDYLNTLWDIPLESVPANGSYQKLTNFVLIVGTCIQKTGINGSAITSKWCP